MKDVSILREHSFSVTSVGKPEISIENWILGLNAGDIGNFEEDNEMFLEIIRIGNGLNRMILVLRNLTITALFQKLVEK